MTMPHRRLPPRGTRIRLETVELPELKQTSPDDSGASAYGNNERARRLRANCARRCWRLMLLDGVPTGSGLFVGQEAYAAGRGWVVEHDLPGGLHAGRTPG